MKCKRYGCENDALINSKTKKINKFHLCEVCYKKRYTYRRTFSNILKRVQNKGVLDALKESKYTNYEIIKIIIEWDLLSSQNIQKLYKKLCEV